YLIFLSPFKLSKVQGAHGVRPLRCSRAAKAGRLIGLVRLARKSERGAAQNIGGRLITAASDDHKVLVVTLVFVRAIWIRLIWAGSPFPDIADYILNTVD